MMPIFQSQTDSDKEEWWSAEFIEVIWRCVSMPVSLAGYYYNPETKVF